jgi:hypothetical protein
VKGRKVERKNALPKPTRQRARRYARRKHALGVLAEPVKVGCCTRTADDQATNEPDEGANVYAVACVVFDRACGVYGRSREMFVWYNE